MVTGVTKGIRGCGNRGEYGRRQERRVQQGGTTGGGGGGGADGGTGEVRTQVMGAVGGGREQQEDGMC